MTKTKPTEDEFKIVPGQEIETHTSKYVVIEKIGEGGFGAVFKVSRKGEKEVYAMKIEKMRRGRKKSKLVMEAHLLKLLAEKAALQSHFVKIVDRSKHTNFFLIVMTLVGESLSDLKRQRTPHVFSVGTGLAAGIQCLEAIEELHKAGYIHRDIKGANFSIGCYPLTHLIYILDFGMARKYTTDENTVKSPRRKVGFKGTVTFAALDCHLGKELGPKHDCESWLYMMVDFCNEERLPWQKDRACAATVIRKKKKARSEEGKRRLFKPMCVEAMSSIMDYIDMLAYPDKVDYQFISRTVVRAGEVLEVNLGGNFDWEGCANEEEVLYTSCTAVTGTS